jgi:hypothetical protein
MSAMTRALTLLAFVATMIPSIAAAQGCDRACLRDALVIEDQKIRSIYSAMFYPPPEAPVPNWPPYDGNWPIK